jgi:hypothetical protein
MNKNWVRFATSNDQHHSNLNVTVTVASVLTASALAAFEGARLVRHRSRR